jgi:hypothetical protein
MFSCMLSLFLFLIILVCVSFSCHLKNSSGILVHIHQATRSDICEDRYFHIGSREKLKSPIQALQKLE